MSKRTLWRLTITALICVACGWFFLPTSKIRLGLDLRGGVHFELEVQGHEALEADLRDHKDRVQERLREKGFPAAIARIEGMQLKIEGVPADQKPTAEKALGTFGGYAATFAGDHITLVQKDSYQKSLKDDANKRAQQIIENRINQFGVAEPEITPSGPEGNRIVVELPGVGEAERERIKGLLSTPGRLELRMMAKQGNPSGYATREQALAAFNGQLPEGTELIPEPENEIRNEVPGAPKVKAKHQELKIRRWVLLETKVQFDGSSITDANRSENSQTGGNEVNFVLDRAGADANARVTGIAADEGRLFAFVLDRKAVSVVRADQKIIGNGVRISGSFTAAEADDIALKLKSGSMRASMKFLEEKSMSASLGADSIRSGVIASLIGFGTIIIFMVLFYHWSGLNAIVALSVNLIVMLGLLGSFRATLTLPGIAGFALTLGIAVDANILIFERIKEELSNGKSVAGAIHTGFDKVFWTIVDSHVTQLFAAMLLFIFGTGPVKGFAVTLTVGVVASLFTSIYISRFIYDWILERHPGTKAISIGTHGFFHNAKFDFMRWKGLALALSWGIIIVCLILVQPWKGSQSRVKLGMQFTGGIDRMVRFRGDVPQDAVRSALIKGGIADAAVVAYENSDKTIREYSVKVKAKKGQDEKDSTAQIQAITQALKALDPAAADPRPDLNIEPVGSLWDKWAKANPLQVPGDEQAIRAAYETQVAKIALAREKFAPLTSFDQLPKDLPAQLKDGLTKEYRLGPMALGKLESFSPSISGEWTRKTLTAVGWALFAILCYVVLRFTLSFSVGGIVALIHDVLMALGLFVLFGYEFSVPVVASFLILIGYSMADTIVVFDRIRENSHKPEYRRVSISTLVNDSINQTLSRTILTACSVLFVAICLWAWGGPALRDLSFPLVIGVITGTYSSIYIASPVVVYWEKWFGGKDNLKQKHV